MSWLNNVVGLISPKKAYEREAWELQRESLRSYDAGNFGRINSNWRVNTHESAEMADSPSRDIIRARARDLERNSDIGNAIVNAFTRNIVGKGFQLQARTENKQLNIDIEELWKQWCKAKNCDVTGQQSFNQMLRMAIRRKKVDGGLIFKKCYTPGGVVPFKLQALEVDELDISQFMPKNKNNKVVGGIEYNEYHRPVGYWFRQYSVDGYEETAPIYCDANDVIFYYTKTRPSQIREMSDLAQTITRVRDVNEFMNAVSVKERIMACLSVFIKKVIPGGTGIGRNNTGITASKDYDGKMLTPGMISELNAGDEVQVVDPKGGSTEATDYIKTQERLLGAGQGLSYEAMTRDMSGSTYSSARQSAIEDEQTFAEDIELLQENVMAEIYESFVISGILSGNLNIPDFWGKKVMYLRHDWVASPRKWIDPLKEANANKVALETGQKTFKQIAAEGGRDWQEQIDDMAEVQAYAESKGVAMTFIQGGGDNDGQDDQSAYDQSDNNAEGNGNKAGAGKQE